MKFLSILLLSLILTSCAKPNDPQKEYPLLMKQVRPDYPMYAFQNRIEGNVEFDFDVDAEGKVSEMRITKSEPQHLFDDAVIRAVSQWRYEKNKPAKDMHINIKFTINQKY
ncbi:TonB family protein [Erwinia sp. S38]|uniref:TonB family protein n=1 Tax=Erwinia sp. S38 TaxID=2769338 RepID=UPI0019099530|nr:TonB family protein [Erwinia sp. S38]MBK0003380.1 TonB family protein [Erwinia sp. S38]